MIVIEQLRQRRQSEDDHYLVTRTLAGRTLPLTAVAVLAATSVLFFVTSLQGWVSFAVVAGLGYVAAQTTLSTIVEGRRRAIDRLSAILVYGAFAAAALPLLLIISYTVKQGIGVIDWTFLTRSMFRVNPEHDGGGIYHAVVGTLIQALLATVMAVPVGLLTAISMVEHGPPAFARAVSFTVDVMAGVPSIVAGLFVYAAWILMLGINKSGLAGSIALAVVMLPVVIRSTEQMLRLVPNDLREAAYALGTPKWRTVLKVVLPTALSGIVTGVMLGVARVAGETAPLLLLVGVNQRIEFNPFAGAGQQRPQESLPTMIFEQFGIAAGNTASSPFHRAWGAALVLIVLIGLLNLVAKLIARVTRVRR